jgi:hypothetical protein
MSHWNYGAGQVGRPYESTSEAPFDTKDGAVEAFLELLDEVGPGAVETIKRDLQTAGRHHFRSDISFIIGFDYAEVVEVP